MSLTVTSSSKIFRSGFTNVLQVCVDGDKHLESVAPPTLRWYYVGKSERELLRKGPCKDLPTVLLAVRSDGLMLEHATAAFQDDEDVVVAAVQQNGLALEYASERWRGNRDVVMEAVRENVGTGTGRSYR